MTGFTPLARRLRCWALVAKLGQFADVHDSIVELLRTMDRQMLIEWIGAAGLSSSEIQTIRERSTTIAALSFLHPARKGLADFVLMLLGRHDRVVLGLILELQLSFDWSKRWSWPLLATSFAAEIRRKAVVVVFCPDPRLRDAIRRRLLPKMEPRPLLIEPDQIPLICDAAGARRQPRETIFAALYHVREIDEPIDERVAGIRAAVIAVRTLDHQEQLRYGELMLSFTPPQIMQRAIDELQASGALDGPDPDESVVYEDSYAHVHGLQKGLALILTPSTLRVLEQGQKQGREQGREEGREQGREEASAAQRATLRRVILDILEARGLTVTPAARVRIEACNDIEVLARWCTEASTHSDDLFTPPDPS